METKQELTPLTTVTAGRDTSRAGSWPCVDPLPGDSVAFLGPKDPEAPQMSPSTHGQLFRGEEDTNSGEKLQL